MATTFTTIFLLFVITYFFRFSMHRLKCMQEGYCPIRISHFLINNSNSWIGG
jgi:hypothetical protein